MVKNLPANAGDLGSVTGLERFPEKEAAILSNILAWKIPWIKEPDGLQSTGLQQLDMT